MTKLTSSEDPGRDLSNLFSQPPPLQQLDFMDMLPSDIILAIFSYLNQHDCLTSMAVCRDWYHTIPQYTQEIWKTVHFRASDKIEENLRQIRCLGDHVKNVALIKFKEHDLYYIMYMLVQWGCKQIQFLELSDCTSSEDQEVFLAVLKKLAPSLLQLNIIHHRSNIPFLHVLDTCPQLSSFTFSPSIRTRWRENMYDKEPSVDRELSTTQFSNISYLCLDIVLHKEIRFEPILKRCPNLRWFIGASTDKQPLDRDTPYSTIAIDLETALNWCPKLVCFQGNLSYSTWKDKFEYNSVTGNGIRYLSQCQDYGRDQIALNLVKAKDTLEYFSLRKCAYLNGTVNWTPVFQTTQLPNLRVLYIYDPLEFDVRSLFVMLNHSVLIEKLVLGCQHLTINLSAVRALQLMNHLRYLELISIYPLKDDVLLSLLDRLPMLEHLVLRQSNVSLTLPYTDHQRPTRLKHLEFVTMSFTCSNNADKEEAAAYFFEYLIAQSKIETIDLSNVDLLGSKVLKVIGSIPTLKFCQLELDEVLPVENIQAGLLDFVITLKHTMIERLQLSRLQCVPFEVFDALGSLPFLVEISIPENPLFSQAGYTRVDGSGLLQMIRKSTTLRDISLENVIIEHEEQVGYYDNLAILLEREMPFFAVSGSPQILDFATKESFIYELLIKHRAK